MPKNVIFLHLESVSNTILWQYRAELETVWRLRQGSLRFNNFHSNATSTQMAASYLLFGSTAIYDYLSYYNETAATPPPHFMDLSNYLIRAGYVWRGYTLDYFMRQEKVIYNWYHFNNSVNLFNDMKKFIVESTASGKRFSFYFNNQVSHMALDDSLKFSAASFSERFRLGYRSLDASVNQLLSILVETETWDNTMIVAFGDHGDEMWSHGLNRGYCHGIPPYASLTWTPLFFFNSGKPSGDDDRLVQITDLGKTALNLAINGFVPDPALLSFDKVPFAGDDVFSWEKDLVFSQNLYALQLEHRDPEEGMFKGYSVTDGVFHLVVSSGGNRPKEGGMEFFCNRVDPTNSRNFLDFFILSVDGTPLRFRPPSEAVAKDFSIVFNPAAVEDMMARYTRLRQRLHDYVRAKEQLALQFNGGGPYHVMPEKVFTVAKKRIRRD